MTTFSSSCESEDSESSSAIATFDALFVDVDVVDTVADVVIEKVDETVVDEVDLVVVDVDDVDDVDVDVGSVRLTIGELDSTKSKLQQRLFFNIDIDIDRI